MGASLAQVYSRAGWNTVLYNRSEKGLERAERLIALNQDTMIREGLLTEEDARQMSRCLSMTTEKAAFAQADLVVENIKEDMEVKKKFWEETSRMTKESALLATNTSGLSITEIARAVWKPQRFMGQHWLNPPHLLPLCEIVIGQQTSWENAQSMRALLKEMGKQPVVVKDIRGFIINRIQFALLREALYIVESGERVNSVADLRGRTIYASGKGATPEYALNYILSENGVDPEKDVNIEWKSEHAECLAALLAEENAVAMLPQPFVTTAQMKSDKIKVRLDLNAEWDAVQAGSDAPSQLITGVVAARKAFIEENPEAVAAFMESYAASVEFVNANVDEAAELIGRYEIVPAAVAKKAIPACNITFLAGGEMRQALSGYLNVLFEQNPKAVGGALPGEDFYYGGN